MASSPRDNLADLLRRSIEAGRSLPRKSRAEFEAALHDLIADPPGREHLEDLLEEVRARSRRGVDALVDFVRAEVRREVAREARRRREETMVQMGQGLEHLGSLFERLVTSWTETDSDDVGRADETAANAAGGSQTRPAPVPEARAPAPPTSTVPNTSTAVKAAGSKKSAGKKSAAKKSAAKKSAGKKSAGKKSAGKKSAGKKSAAKKTAAKKSVAKQAAASAKAPSKKAATPRVPPQNLQIDE
jgi:hypothetical protein